MEGQRWAHGLSFMSDHHGIGSKTPKMAKDKIMVITLSGRGDKDVAAIARYRGENLYD